MSVEGHYKRADLFLRDRLQTINRSQIERLIQSGNLTLNGNPLLKKSTPLKPGDQIYVSLPHPEKSRSSHPPRRELVIRYEDDDLLLIDKPTGISVHPGSGKREETILDLFSHYYPAVGEMDEPDRPGIVHRLDKETSGILILAKTRQAWKRMQKQFKRREVKKVYFALVKGSMRYLNGTVNLPLIRSRRQRTRFEVCRDERPEARAAVTDYTVLKNLGDSSLVKVYPLTGRTHQIRVHLASLGNPILGDRTYGAKEGFHRLGLHAYSVHFSHPTSHRPMECQAPLPDSFRRFIREKIRASAQS